MRLAQIKQTSGARAVVVTDQDSRLVNGVTTTYELAMSALHAGRTLVQEIAARGTGEAVDLAALLVAGQVLSPIDHADTAHVMVAGTGLTHLGSAEGRDKMHKNLSDAVTLTDSMKMFKMGLEGGKPSAGQTGVQPEWFYKGDGSTLVPPQCALPSPSFGLDGGEEPEIAGIYIIAPDGTPVRLGFALGNEFSDHVTERQNYLFLAHSKLRASSIGPELLIGELPADVRGASRIWRDGKAIFDKPFISGEANMSHSVENLEHHHFKYALFRRPGDVHVHYFGTATLSFSDNIRTQEGDIFEIEAPAFGLPLRNSLKTVAAEAVKVKAL
jgi:hypothetical protein